MIEMYGTGNRVIFFQHQVAPFLLGQNMIGDMAEEFIIASM
jgi:hypothetical protein